jgi:large subunit ribosomal protein L9
MMEVILLEKIRNLGNLGDKITVRGGYGRNYLIPYGKAVLATKENLASFEVKRAEFEASQSEKLAAALARKEKILAVAQVIVAAQAADEGRLYGSVGPREIAEAMTQQGLEILKSEVRMPLGPIREVGETTLALQLHTDVVADIVVKVVASE